MQEMKYPFDPELMATIRSRVETGDIAVVPVADTSRLIELFNAEQVKSGAMQVRRKELEAKGMTFVRAKKIGRNSPCPCGSGKKFKKCHINSLQAAT